MNAIQKNLIRKIKNLLNILVFFQEIITTDYNSISFKVVFFFFNKMKVGVKSNLKPEAHISQSYKIQQLYFPNMCTQRAYRDHIQVRDID
jgi:hypothetical protein